MMPVRTPHRRLLPGLFLLLWWCGSAVADEGMWPLDNLPREALRRDHGFDPDERWISQAMQGTVRLAGGCSGSLVSPHGLVLTNHHCIVGCVQSLSSPAEDLVAGGFIARQRSAERQCPGMEVNRLESTRDVTAAVNRATRGLAGEAWSETRQAEFARLQNRCAGRDPARIRCDIVELYQGAVVHLYRYERFTDIRLVFAPEYAAGFFGGDPDNFNFPRYNLDMGLLRIHDGDRPLATPIHFPVRVGGAAENELVMTLGHPGSTERLLTVAQLTLRRDHLLPFQLLLDAEYRGLLSRYAGENPEQARIARSDLTMLENGLKAMGGEHQALTTPGVLADKAEAENDLAAWVAARDPLAGRIGNPWQAIEAATRTTRELYRDYLMIEAGYGYRGELAGFARRLVRAAYERNKPAEQRLEGYADADLPAVQARITAQRPVYAGYETLRLAWSLGKLREVLGVDHPFVRELLGQDSPQVLAERIAQTSKLADPAVRKALWDGGVEAIEGSDDPAIRLARIIEATARPLHGRYKASVEAPLTQAAKALAEARFARFGTSVYPDATFSLRASFGTISGWTENGRSIPAFTTLAGLYARATPHDPFRLAPTWEEVRDRLAPDLRFNQVSTNDITGGNSGSPLVNRAGEIVGLIFDGNIHSLGGSFFYDGAVNRAVSVHPAAIVAALREVYGATTLLDEMSLR